ncbi:hypothetical protein B296_00005431 [Ensete ventricosum]|uniref:glutamate decarboxylase n=1 Tax=Ensete ventricosum TaxID=4639 RepID=A0A427A7Y0_ENSVE|nr:hypothetical protein B296_00005431 [Ensete ventricosum]
MRTATHPTFGSTRRRHQSQPTASSQPLDKDDREVYGDISAASCLIRSTNEGGRQEARCDTSVPRYPGHVMLLPRFLSPAFKRGALVRVRMVPVEKQVQDAGAVDTEGGGVPDHKRRADAGREPAVEPGVVRDDMDGAGVRPPHHVRHQQELRRHGWVCWEKFAKYFEVELKEVKLREGFYVMDPVKAVEMVDENTICVAAILGSTLTGEFEDIKLLNHLLTEKNRETGWSTPIHVDAASGGFVAPFLYPDLEWDFRLPLVKSINVSSSQIIAQYYQFIRLGFEVSTCSFAFLSHYVMKGYRSIMKNCMENAKAVKEGIQATGRFEMVSGDVGVPLVAFSLRDSSRYTVFDVSQSLRRFGWIVPAYTMPANAEHVAVLRVVIREDFSGSLAERLVSDIRKVVADLDGRWSRTAIVAEVKAEEKPGGVVAYRKSVRETTQPQEIDGDRRGRVDRKKTSGVC